MLRPYGLRNLQQTTQLHLHRAKSLRSACARLARRSTSWLIERDAPRLGCMGGCVHPRGRATTLCCTCVAQRVAASSLATCPMYLLMCNMPVSYQLNMFQGSSRSCTNSAQLLWKSANLCGDSCDMLSCSGPSSQDGPDVDVYILCHVCCLIRPQ